MKAYEMAKKYYPRLWSVERIEALYKSGKLTEEEYNTLVENTTTEEEGGK